MASSMANGLQPPSSVLPSGLATKNFPDAAALSRDSIDSQDDTSIRQAAIDFETAFIGQMLKFSGLGDALVKGGGEDVAAFTDFYIQSFAEKISNNGGFGLADKFYAKLKLTAGSITPTAHDSMAVLNSPVTINKEIF